MRYIGKILFVILFLASCLISIGDPGYSYKFERVAFSDELPQLSIKSIIQNRQGFMWFATQGGLVKYDGYKTRVYSFISGNPNSLGSNDIRILYEDSRGLIWIGLLGGGLDCFDPVSETFTHFRSGPGSEYSFGSNYVHAICEDKKGDLWVGSYSGGFARLHVELNQGGELQFGFTRYIHSPGNPNSLSNNIVRTLCPDRFGAIWIGTADGLNRFDPETGTFTRYHWLPDNPDSLSSNQISRVMEDRSGILWVGTLDAGINRMRIGDSSSQRAVVTRYRAAPTGNSGLSSDMIRCIFEDSRGNLWIGTTNGGLNKFEKETGTFSSFKHNPVDSRSLSGSSVISVAEDRTGNLWIGTVKSGISKLNFNSRHFFNLVFKSGQEQDLNASVFAVFEDRYGNLWTGGENGWLYKSELGKSKELDFNIRHLRSRISKKISDFFIRAIHMDNRDHLWLGTRGGGLIKINPRDLNTGNHEVYRHDPADPGSIGGNSVYSICQDRTGTLWIGTGERGISLLNPENRERGYFFRKRHTDNDPYSLSHNFVRVIYEDSREIIWVGTDSGGLNRYDRGKNRFKRYSYSVTNHNSISSNCVLSILEGSDGTLWVGTADAGLNKFLVETETFSCYSLKDGLPDNTIYGLLEDDRNHIWISTKKGLARFNPRSETFVVYTDKEGIQGNEFNSLACFKSPANGQLYFGGINGVTTFFPGNIKKNSAIPPIQIISFEVLNRNLEGIQVADNTQLTLSYRDYMFSFEFVALDFTAPRKNRYCYILEGFNPDWIYTDWSNRRATFTNIPPGSYTFRVRGSNNHGVWNETGVSVHIVIEPPFWQTWWFRIAVILVVSLLILTLHKMRMRNQRIRLKTESEINRIYEKTRMTPREIEIIELLKKRKSYKQIEDELFISFHTVKNHIQSIFKKLGVNDKIELIYYLKSVEDEVREKDS